MAAGDVLPAVDISDSTQNAHGSLDAITVTNFFASIPVPVVVTSASANALAVGLAGASNSAFLVDCSTALQVAGLKVTGAVTGGTVAVVVTDSGLNASLTVNAKGTGTIGIGSVSTGRVTITPVTTITGSLTLSAALVYGGVTLTNAVTGTGNMVLSAGPTLTGTLTAAIANFSGAVSTAGLSCTTLAGTGAVSGFTTSSWSGTITSTVGNNTTVLNAASATTGYQQILFQNTSGALQVAVNGSTGTALITGGTAYAAQFNSLLAIDFGTAGARRGGFSAAGAFDVNNGLTVSAGTTAVQALTATSLTVTNSATQIVVANRTDAAGNLGHYFVQRGGVFMGYLGTDASDNLVIAGKTVNNSITINKSTDAVTFLAGISCTTGTFSGGVVSSTGTQAVSNGATTTFATITVEGCYLVSVHNGANFATIGWYLTGSTFTAILTQTNSTTTSFQVSGNNVQITNTTGGSVTYTWSILRIS